MFVFEYIAVALASYLLGSIPTGVLVSKIARGIDVRNYGSGNIGATNVGRTLGFGAFLLVFLCDFLKGLVPVLLAGEFVGTPLSQAIAGLAALVGHNWSLYLGFRGGRGVATGIGAMFGMALGPALAVTVVTVGIILLSRYVSLGSVVGAIITIPAMVLAVLLGVRAPEYLLYAVPGAVMVIYRHRENIDRLRRGTERKIAEPAALLRRLREGKRPSVV